MKKPKHSANFLFGNSPKAKVAARKLTEGKVLCEGCLEELAAKIDESYKYRYLLLQHAKALKHRRVQVKQLHRQMGELRKFLREQKISDVGRETNIYEHLMRFIGNLR
jgi:hypothetical protein